MSETLKAPQVEPNEGSSGNDMLPPPVETVFHGTSVQAAKNILEEGFKPAPYGRRPELGPISWFSTEDELAKLYGLETRVRDGNGMLAASHNSNSDPNAPSYSVIVEAEIPRSSDPRGFNTFENGIEYVGTTRIVTALGMSLVAMRTMKLYEHKPTGKGTSSVRLIDEYSVQPTQSVIEHVRNKIRRKKNEMMGRPTLVA